MASTPIDIVVDQLIPTLRRAGVSDANASRVARTVLAKIRLIDTAIVMEALGMESPPQARKHRGKQVWVEVEE